MRVFTTTIASLILSCLPGLSRAQLTLSKDADSLPLDKGLSISGVGESGRRPINTDLVVWALARGTLNFNSVKPGDELAPGKAWGETEASSNGFSSAGRSTYILTRVQADTESVMMLEASGHAVVYVNGEPRVGDPYGHGFVKVPVSLHKGENTFLFSHAGRGGLRAKLLKPSAEAIILERDLTLPDADRSKEVDALIGVPVANASDRERTLVLTADAGLGVGKSASYVFAPGVVTKVPVSVRVPPSDTPLPVRMTVLEGEKVITEYTASLGAPASGSAFKITYVSRVDGSVQYASIVPPPAHEAGAHPALVLSLHGASVEATNQAASYAPHEGLLIACPTNRRPFGFDWEDWGRIDAIEVMDLVRTKFATDPARQYLTGHSMGGHGTWNIGVLYPQQFAAIAPSAGWLSFDTYTSQGGPAYASDGEVGDVFRAARASSDTPRLMGNLRSKGIYILHGDADDNVPVEQARQAREILDRLKIPFEFHEQPGAGHWWDDDNPGAACVDWPGIWETFAAHRLPELPGQPAAMPPIDERGFAKGSFKRAFDHEFVLVYSTAGTSDENAWSFAKARFDAEQWWYRGNGRASLLSDAEFLASPTKGNVILYGNRLTNRAWASLLGAARLNVEGGRLSIAGNTLTGEDIAFLGVAPRADVPDRLVGMVAGTGLVGMRTADRLPYFTSGVGFPEVTIVRANAWRDGFTGVAGAGTVDAMVWSPEDAPK